MRGHPGARVYKEHTPKKETGAAKAADMDRRADPAWGGAPYPGTMSTSSAATHAPVPEKARDPESAARELALRFLERRARTRKELLAHLRQRGIPDELSESITCRFEETGLIDDQGLAERWVVSRQGGKSARQLQAELVRRGVDRDVADSAAGAVSDDVEEAAMLRLIDRRAAAMRHLSVEVRQRRLMAQLARRGYAADAARRCIQRALGDLADGAYDRDGAPLSEGPDFLDQV